MDVLRNSREECASTIPSTGAEAVSLKANTRCYLRRERLRLQEISSTVLVLPPGFVRYCRTLAPKGHIRPRPWHSTLQDIGHICSQHILPPDLYASYAIETWISVTGHA